MAFPLRGLVLGAFMLFASLLVVAFLAGQMESHGTAGHPVDGTFNPESKVPLPR